MVAAVRLIESNPKLRVLRQAQLPRLGTPSSDSVVWNIAFCSAKTIGKNPRTGVILDFAITLCKVDIVHGSLLAVEREYSGQCDPERQISDAVLDKLGLKQEDLAGKKFDSEAVESILDDSDVVISCGHDSQSSFVAKYFPAPWERRHNIHWVHLLKTAFWRKIGAPFPALPAIALAAGMFAPGCRASDDVVAMIASLLSKTGAPFVSSIFRDIQEDWFAIAAESLPAGQEEKLFERGGYSYSNGEFKGFVGWIVFAPQSRARLEFDYLKALGAQPKSCKIPRARAMF